MGTVVFTKVRSLFGVLGIYQSIGFAKTAVHISYFAYVSLPTSVTSAGKFSSNKVLFD
jgi:hypothetical protein